MSCLSKGNQIFKLLLKTNHQLNKNACITACSAGITSILNSKKIHDDSKNKTSTLDPKKFNRVSLFILISKHYSSLIFCLINNKKKIIKNYKKIHLDGSPTTVEERPKFVEIYYNPDEAVRDIESKSTLLVGGFGVCGVPEDLINAISKRNINELTVVSNNAGLDNVGLGILLKKKQVNI